MNFNFDEFAKKMHSDYGQQLSEQEVYSLLDPKEDGYERSSPKGLGKSLLLREVQLIGKKENGDEINYRKTLYSGVNMWVTDNLKGKSSLFKAIKYVLTGRSKIADDVEKWIKKILLKFSIGEDIYTIVLDLSKKKLHTSFYTGSWEGDEETEPDRIFKSGIEYSEFIENFFFEQLDYYPLKKVQSTQGKLLQILINLQLHLS